MSQSGLWYKLYMFPDLDPVLHAPARLQMVVLLERVDGDRTLTFPQLQQLTGATAGNLSTHLRRLEEVGYVAVTKTYDDRTPVTRAWLTAAGHRALEEYRQRMREHLDGQYARRLLEEGRI